MKPLRFWRISVHLTLRQRTFLGKFKDPADITLSAFPWPAIRVVHQLHNSVNVLYACSMDTGSPRSIISGIISERQNTATYFVPKEVHRQHSKWWLLLILAVTVGFVSQWLQKNQKEKQHFKWFRCLFVPDWIYFVSKSDLLKKNYWVAFNTKIFYMIVTVGFANRFCFCFVFFVCTINLVATNVLRFST